MTALHQAEGNREEVEPMMPVAVIDQLTFTYQQEHTPALNRISFTVKPGEFLTITGPSGCGKSTLALCLAGFIPYAFPGQMEGSVIIQGCDTRLYPEGGLSGIVGLVQQDPEGQLCTLSVQDEIAFGPENLCVPSQEIRERITFALEAVDGMDLIHRQVHTLSGGEKQRVAIASVLAMKPSLLILDEPTANLDPRCTQEVLRVLENLRREQAVSVIVIEHRLEHLLPLSDRVLVMDQGSLIREITKDELQNRTGWVRDLGDYTSRIPVDAGCGAAATGTPLLEVEGLEAGYEGRKILHNLRFSLHRGETVAIMGANGSGKTTLALALLGILKPYDGDIRMNSQSMLNTKIAHRARQMGLVFQNPHHQLFESSVWKEASLPASRLSEETAETIDKTVHSLLQAFQLDPYREKNPFALSLGEKKRLTVVSVLAYSPDLLILDEPLVGQDQDRMRNLMQLIDHHRQQGGSTLMICHEPAVVEAFCQRVIFLEQGEIMVDALTAEAFEQLADRGYRAYVPQRYAADGREEGS
jgi:energy-coupling factor transport system ATP-binding protein